MPFSQSSSATLASRLNLTGWPSVASRCLSSPVWRSPWRRKRKLEPYLSRKSCNGSCHVVWAVAPSRCRIFLMSVSGLHALFPTYLECFDTTNSLQVETPIVIHLPSVRCDGQSNSCFSSKMRSLKNLRRQTLETMWEYICRGRDISQLTSTACPALFRAMAAESPAIPPPTIPISRRLWLAIVSMFDCAWWSVEADWLEARSTRSWSNLCLWIDSNAYLYQRQCVAPCTYDKHDATHQSAACNRLNSHTELQLRYDKQPGRRLQMPGEINRNVRNSHPSLTGSIVSAAGNVKRCPEVL